MIDDKYLKILSDKTRLKILKIISEEGEITNSKLAKMLKLSRATITHHLKILEENGFIYLKRVEEERGIPTKYYAPTFEKVKEAWLKNLDEIIKNKENGNKIAYKFLKYDLLYNRFLPEDIINAIGYDFGMFISKYIDGKGKKAVLENLAEFWTEIGLGKAEIVDGNGFRVYECYQCYGMPNIGKTFCTNDAKTIEAVLNKKTKKRFRVKEVACWGLGNKYCEFEIK